jgi:hypothetical protein
MLRAAETGVRQTPEEFLAADRHRAQPYRLFVELAGDVVVVALECARVELEPGGEGVQFLERGVAHQVGEDAA